MNLKDQITNIIQEIEIGHIHTIEDGDNKGVIGYFDCQKISAAISDIITKDKIHILNEIINWINEKSNRFIQDECSPSFIFECVKSKIHSDIIKIK